MADINFNNVKFSQNHEDRIENVKRECELPTNLRFAGF